MMQWRPTYFISISCWIKIIAEARLKLRERPRCVVTSKLTSCIQLVSLLVTTQRGREAATICSRLARDFDLWPFDLESGVRLRVTCDVGYLSANFSLPRPLCSRLRFDVRDRRQTDRRQTDVRQTGVWRASSLNAPSAGHNKQLTGVGYFDGRHVVSSL